MREIWSLNINNSTNLYEKLNSDMENKIVRLQTEMETKLNIDISDRIMKFKSDMDVVYDKIWWLKR